MLNEDVNIDMPNRLPKANDDELHLYKGRIYDNCKSGDDRLQIRILPFMADLPDNELSNLPKFSPFFKGQVIRGITEADATDDQPASLVYVLATSDFTFGFVLGTVNEFDSIGEAPMVESWNYPEAKQCLQRSGAIADSFDYENIAVDMSNATSTILEMHDVKKGSKWIMTCTGDIFTIQQGLIYMCSRRGTESGANMSSIKIQPESIKITTTTLDISAKHIIMGKHGHYLLGTLASAPVSCDGINLTPVTNIMV